MMPQLGLRRDGRTLWYNPWHWRLFLKVLGSPLAADYRVVFRIAWGDR